MLIMSSTHLLTLPRELRDQIWSLAFSDIIVTPGLINRDFSDIRATMVGMGYAMMGTATAAGENAAVEAARQAISCPLLEDTRITGSRDQYALATLVATAPE